MSENNRTYRIRTNVGAGEQHLNVFVDQDYENFNILSLNIERENIYKMHTANYGCVAGRVLANGSYGIPNAKISVFIKTEESDDIDPVLKALYPYETVLDKNSDKIRYNTLPDEKLNKCHQAVGTMPNKRLVLDDNNVLEVYKKYYKYTAVSNESGDYMIFGVPVGEQVIHVDIDLSDIGDLSQTPIDMMFKGYNKNQFESSSMFKSSNELDTLTQIISQDSNVYVNPFWGDESVSEISITRNDIDIKYKFEPSCVFIGSLITDGDNNGVSQNCIPSKGMGTMAQLKGGSGTIEMIRKTPNGDVESFVINGTRLIDGNGTWCYQIPMNLDYVGTDEYGNKVATNDPNKGVPTRTRVRFRVSLTDTANEYVNNHLAKVLIPNNPQKIGETDYVFGTYSLDDDGATKSFRDLFSNNVYTVKSYIPRIQKSNAQRNSRFTGFKNITVNNGNNPLPYNNMRVNLTFMFVLQCAILKILIRLVRFLNRWRGRNKNCITLGDGVCPDLEGWYFAPGCKNGAMAKTLQNINNDDSQEGEKESKNEIEDPNSVDSKNNDNNSICLTKNIDYLMQCVEINLAMENNVIQFDFYNDWINGMIYIPHWYGNIRRKRTYLFGTIKLPEKVQACMEDTYFNTRKFVQQCALSYNSDSENAFTKIATPLGCKSDDKQKCHKGKGRKYIKVLGKNGGLVHNETTLKQEHVYYFKPCEWTDEKNNFPKRVNMFATDIVLLGSLREYNKDGIPTAFRELRGTSYKMPGNLLSTNLETDGPIYGMPDGSLCNGTSYNDGVKSVTDYEKYAKNTDENDPDIEKDSEYKLSEMSGIDWGYTGPGQGENNLSNLYFPGGHFLGISCMNPEVNIKSCVNLSRACEIGTMLSQYQAIANKINNGEISYLIRTPNGLISRYEIDDNEYRNIFATLNFNGLRTIFNKETKNREYVFNSNVSYNFDGVLADKVDNSSYNSPQVTSRFNDNNKKLEVYQNAVEKTSYEYYKFRLGLDSLENIDKVKSKYLINELNEVSLPMYNNSLYFYFGIKEGLTAYDRFLDDFYSVCPDETLTTPSISINNIINEDFCTDNKGCADISIDGLGSAYSLELYKKDQNGEEIKQNIAIDNDETGGVAIIISNNSSTSLNVSYRNFKIGKCGTKLGLVAGDYVIRITLFIDQKQYEKEFTIGLNAPNSVNSIMNTIIIDNFREEFSNDNDNQRGPDNDQFGGSILVEIPGNYQNYINDIILKKDSGEVICSIKESGIGYVSILYSSEENTKRYRFYVPYGNESYKLTYVLDSCEYPYTSDNTYYVSMPTKFDFYFGDTSANGQAIKKVLGLKYEDKLNYEDESKTKEWYKSEKLTGLTSEQLWFLERSLIYNHSMFNGIENSIKFGLFGGNKPYTQTVYGHGEKQNSDGTYDLIQFTDKDNNDGYIVDYSSHLFPTVQVDNFNELKYDKRLKEFNLLQKDNTLSGIIDYKIEISDYKEYE